MSKYAHSCAGDSWGWGESIIPLSFEEAQERAEKYAQEKYEDIFGKIPEDECRFQITISIQTKDKLNLLKTKTGKTYSQIIEDLINSLPEC